MKHSNYLAIIFITGLGGGLILKVVNNSIGSAKIATTANVLMAAPVIILVCMIPIIIVINRAVDRKLYARNKKRRNQQTPAGDAETNAPEE